MKHTVNKEKVKFLLFLGAIFLFYSVMFFPKEEEVLNTKKILLDIGISIFMAFITTYFSFWGVNYIDKNILKKKE